MNRGSIMVSATVDPAQSDRAEDILEKHGTVDIDEREISWRKEGWRGYLLAQGRALSKRLILRDRDLLQPTEERLSQSSKSSSRSASAGSRVAASRYAVTSWKLPYMGK
jgi:hypothetical protein